jgi:hypothetical protein
LLGSVVQGVIPLGAKAVALNSVGHSLKRATEAGAIILGFGLIVLILR